MLEEMTVVLQLGEKAAEPETTVQDCVSTFGIKPLDISNKTMCQCAQAETWTDRQAGNDTKSEFYEIKTKQKSWRRKQELKNCENTKL